jgi:hypothetical protein
MEELSPQLFKYLEVFDEFKDYQKVLHEHHEKHQDVFKFIKNAKKDGSVNTKEMAFDVKTQKAHHCKPSC